MAYTSPGAEAARGATRPRASASTRLLLALLLLGFLGVALFHNLTYPIWEGGDEPQHFEQIRALARDHALPRPVDWTTTPMPLRNMSHHPPLYYAVQALATGWSMPQTAGPVWHANPFVTWPEHPAADALAVHTPEESQPFVGTALAVHAARFVSSLFGLLIVLAAYLLASELMGAGAGLVAAAVVAFTPAVVNLSGTVNNEVAAAGLGALALAFAVRTVTRGGNAVKAGLLIGGLCAAAGLAKLTGLFGLPVALLAGLLAPNLELAGAKGARARLLFGALVLGLPALAMGAWYVSVGPDWALVVYDSELGGAAGAAAGPWFLTPFDPAAWPRFAVALPHLFASYWGMLGAVSGAFYLPDYFYIVVGAVCLAGLAGLLAFAFRRDGWSAAALERRRALSSSSSRWPCSPTWWWPAPARRARPRASTAAICFRLPAPTLPCSCSACAVCCRDGCTFPAPCWGRGPCWP